MTASVLFVGDEKEIETVEDYLHTALESHVFRLGSTVACDLISM